MLRVPSTSLLLLPVLFAHIVVSGQAAEPSQKGSASSASTSASSSAAAQESDPTSTPPAVSIASDAPHMCKETRYNVIRDFEMQLVYARTSFPMGSKGLQLREGAITPTGEEMRQALAIWGPAVKPGDPAHISYVRIRDNYIHFEINGGPVHRKKWYEHIEISGTGGGSATPLDQQQANPHGSFVDVYFTKYVPEMTAQQLRDLLYPVLDFKARNKEQAYLDTVPPKAKEAIQAHHVLVGMNSEMVVHAKGKASKKVRERDGETEYEEWIYGEPPADVDFVRIVGDEVVQVKTMKVDGEKIVRTEKETILQQPDREAKAEQEQHPAAPPSLRRPGEDADDVPKPANGATPLPPMAPPESPQPPGNSGPGDVVGTRH